MAKQLKRSSDKMISGVIAGLADYLDIDHTMARILFAVFTFFTGWIGGLVCYLICLALMKD